MLSYLLGVRFIVALHTSGEAQQQDIGYSDSWRRILSCAPKGSQLGLKGHFLFLIFCENIFSIFVKIACENKRDGENFRENLDDNFLENVVLC